MLTKLFTDRFSQQVPPQGTVPATNAPVRAPMAAGATNEAAEAEPGISAETRAQIIDLAGQAADTQDEASRLMASKSFALSMGEQKKAYALLKKIEDLLPKQKQQSKDQQQPQDKQQEQKQQAPQKQEQQPEPQPQKGEMSRENAEKLIQKALQREKDHEDEKRQRDSYLPPSPIERDW